MNEMQKFSPNHRVFILLCISIIMVYGLSFGQRHADYLSFWMKNRQNYVVDHVTLMSTSDGYYWVKMAKELDKGTIGKRQPEITKGYPDGQMLAINDTASLLAELISVAKNFTGGDYYRASIFLVPVLSGLFIFPLFFYFNRIGFGAAAIFGGLFATFGHAYYDRSMAGRVDTDMLNTFFPLATACFILFMSRERSLRANLCLSAGAGLTMYLFTWWYQQASFILVYLLVMAAYLVICRVSWKHLVPALIVFLVATGPENVLQILASLQTFVKAYVSPPPTGGIAWPNILDTVAEAQKRNLDTKLKMLLRIRALCLCRICRRGLPLRQTVQTDDSDGAVDCPWNMVHRRPKPICHVHGPDYRRRYRGRPGTHGQVRRRKTEETAIHGVGRLRCAHVHPVFFDVCLHGIPYSCRADYPRNDGPRPA